MGTRHLIAVQIDGDYKVAQYGQWDGYPSSTGVDILAFLRGMERASFLSKLRAASFYTDDEITALNKRIQDENIVWQRDWPWLSRDAGSDVLSYVAKQPDGIKLKNAIDFAADSLSCEFAYVIDFDKETLEIYKGFNKEPVPEGERFHGATTDDKYASAAYQPVRFVRSYSLASLPTDAVFLAEVEPKDEADE